MRLKGIKMKELIFAVALALTSNCDKNSQGGKVKAFGSLDALNEARNTMINFETYHKDPNFNFDHIHAIDYKWGAVMEPLQQGILNHLRGNVDSSIVNYETALNDIKNLDNLFKNEYRINSLKNVEPLVLYCLGNSYLEKGTNEVALDYYELALEKFKALKFEKGIGDAKAKVAKTYKEMKKNGWAADTYREAIKMKKKYDKSIRERENVIQLYRELSEVLYEMGYSDSFFIYNNRADSLEKETGSLSEDKNVNAQRNKQKGNDLVPYITLSNSMDSIPMDSVPRRAARDMYTSFWQVEQLKNENVGPTRDNMVVYFDSEGNRKITKKDSLYEGFFLTQRGYWHLLRGETDKALNYFIKALNEKNKAIVGAIHEKIGDVYKKQKNYGESEKQYILSIEKNKELECYEGIGGALFGLGDLYKKEKRFKEAVNCYNDGIEAYKTVYPNATRWNIEGYRALAKVYKDSGNIKKLDEYEKKLREEEKREKEAWNNKLKFVK